MLDANKSFGIVSTEGSCSLSTPQVPIWVDQSLYPQTPIYNLGQTVTLRTAVNIRCFVAALERVVAENDSLRLRFLQTDSELLQHAVDHVPVHLKFDDFSAKQIPEEAAAAWIEQIFWEPFGPTDFPLFQFALAKVDTEHFLWLQKYHHLIIDATGRRLVAARVASIYDAILAKTEPPPIEGGSYLALAKAADDQYLASDIWSADEDYWRTRLVDLPEPLVQTDLRFSEKSLSGRPRQLTHILSFEASNALRRFARSQNSTPFKVLLILVWCCLTRLYRKSNLAIGVPLANRKSCTGTTHCGSVRQGDAIPLSARPHYDARYRTFDDE